MSDVAQTAAELVGKPADEFRVDEFKNDEGGYSAALVNTKTGSITLQANASSASEARKRLTEAVERGNVIKLDPAIVPDTGSKDWSGMAGQERADTAVENKQKRADAGRVTDGYAGLAPANSKVTSKVGPREAQPEPAQTPTEPDPRDEKKKDARKDAHQEELGKK